MNDQTEVPNPLKVLLDWLDVLAEAVGSDVELRLARDLSGTGSGLLVAAIYTPNDGRCRVGTMRLSREEISQSTQNTDDIVLSQMADAVRCLSLKPRRLP
jgi:hypothetical protein